MARLPSISRQPRRPPSEHEREVAQICAEGHAARKQMRLERMQRLLDEEEKPQVGEGRGNQW